MFLLKINAIIKLGDFMVGRMLFVGLSTNDKTVIERLIVKCHVGGIILYSKNYHNYQEMLELIRYIFDLAKKEGYPILVGIDQEGYRVNRLPKDFQNLRSPYSFHQNLEDIKKHGEVIATILAASNIRVNFAPVLDIKRFSDHHPIGDRCFGSDVKTVIQNTIPYIEEFEKRGVIPVVKHFPGHGATTINSHYFIPIIFNSKRLLQEDILPFKSAIEHGVDVVMVGHFIVPKLSGWIPTSFSSKTVHYLRNQLNFQKVIMTDDLMMGPLRIFSKVKLMKRAINAGINMIMIKYYDQFFDDFNRLEKSKLNQNYINYSVQLIYELICKYQITNQFILHSLDISKINQEIIELNQHAK